ncbi:energy-coupling factor transporter transmembrane component T family protein [Candidatus Magnetaquicoccus inordinatus]|uniref:energy-coupling factor transporter transmembrane component T family protein n=1 Tax=Candidatus Magnetaquicoccus inordinatus TaxID=2496818 RepID=UPI00102AF993|nr:energy-coupling factor transporter transmembrane component T [Candidatus Magnetaquicoccus inordinatus]
MTTWHVPTRSRQNSFLHQCDPRAKLAALVLLAPLLYRHPILSWEWLGSILLLLFIVQDTFLLWIHSLGRQIWRLRWLFLTILLLHGLLTPGEEVWDYLPWLTWQGVREGVQQLFRIMLLITFAWVLVRTTTPLHWVTGIYRLFSGLERLGIPIQQGCALLAFSLGTIPTLLQEAHHIREERSLRQSAPQQSWSERFEQLAANGSALLFRLMRRASAQEESLLLRGIKTGLPFVILHEEHWHWRDWLLSGWPVLLWLFSWLNT